jgi:hypothetical protein
MSPEMLVLYHPFVGEILGMVFLGLLAMELLRGKKERVRG